MDAARSPASLAVGLAMDARSLDGLKQQARDDQAASARQAARQMEAYFAQQLIGQMRKTSLVGDGPLAKALTGESNDLFRSMLDQQLAQRMAGIGPDGRLTGTGGLGIAEMLEQQLTRNRGAADAVSGSALPLSVSTLGFASATKGLPASRSVADAAALSGLSRRIQNGRFKTWSDSGTAEAVRAEFVGRFLPAARHAEVRTGIPAAFMLGQAALESGWGRREIVHDNGEPSHNLFGIKASGWSGKIVFAMTTEYDKGVAQRVREPFRAYDSYEQAFEDYARLLVTRPRYGAVARAITADQFAEGLQKAGYATDPAYADKLRQVIRLTQDAML